MPTLIVENQRRVRPTKATPDVRIPAGAFSADYRAMSGLGATLQGAGGQFGDIALRTKLLDKSNQIRKGQAAYDEFYTTGAAERFKDTDFANHRKKFGESHDDWSKTYLEGVESPGAKDRLRLYFDQQKAKQGLRIEADAFMALGREIAANQPQARQISIEAELDEPEIDGQQRERADYTKSLDELVKAGHLTPAGKQQELRMRAMQLVQTAADRDPEMVLNAIDEKKLDILLGDEDVKLLLPDDIDALRIDARQELAAANRQVQIDNAARKEASEAKRTEISRKINTPTKAAELAAIREELRTEIINESLFDSADHSFLLKLLDSRTDRLATGKGDGKMPAEMAGKYSKILIRLNDNPDNVKWSEIDEFVEYPPIYKDLVDEKEDKSSLLKNPSVDFWFKKLGTDFADEPVLADKYSRQFRKYFMDYQRMHNKIPSPAEIGEFYDKNFIEPGVIAWLERKAKWLAGAGWSAYKFGSPLGLAGRTVAATEARGREERLNWFADDLESGAETRGGYTIGERLDVGGRKYKVVGFDPGTNEPMVEEIGNK